METLQYREHKRFALQGQVVAVRYLTSPRNTQLGTREVMETTGKHLIRSGHVRLRLPAGPACTGSAINDWTSLWCNDTISSKKSSEKKNSVSLGEGGGECWEMQ